MTRSLYQVPYFELTCAQKHALPHHMFRGARRLKCHDWCLEKLKINVAGQGQPKHLNIQPHGQYHALKTQRIGSGRPTVTHKILAVLLGRSNKEISCWRGQSKRRKFIFLVFAFLTFFFLSEILRLIKHLKTEILLSLSLFLYILTLHLFSGFFHSCVVAMHLLDPAFHVAHLSVDAKCFWCSATVPASNSLHVPLAMKPTDHGTSTITPTGIHPYSTSADHGFVSYVRPVDRLPCVIRNN